MFLSMISAVFFLDPNMQGRKCLETCSMKVKCLIATCFSLQKAQSTYFITQIDPRVSLVVIFESKKSEKDSHTNSFLSDFSAQLRSQWILGSLRHH